MTKYIDYDAKGKFFGSAAEPLSPEGYARYIEQHGHLKAEGYYQAIVDMTAEIGFILGDFVVRNIHPENSHTISSQIVKNYITKLYSHNATFLNRTYGVVSHSIEDNPTPQP